MQILHRTNHRANRRLSHNATRYWARSPRLEVLSISLGVRRASNEECWLAALDDPIVRTCSVSVRPWAAGGPSPLRPFNE